MVTMRCNSCCFFWKKGSSSQSMPLSYTLIEGASFSCKSKQTLLCDAVGLGKGPIWERPCITDEERKKSHLSFIPIRCFFFTYLVLSHIWQTQRVHMWIARNQFEWLSYETKILWHLLKKPQKNQQETDNRKWTCFMYLWDDTLGWSAFLFLDWHLTDHPTL